MFVGKQGPAGMELVAKTDRHALEGCLFNSSLW